MFSSSTLARFPSSSHVGSANPLHFTKYCNCPFILLLSRISSTSHSSSPSTITGKGGGATSPGRGHQRQHVGVIQEMFVVSVWSPVCLTRRCEFLWFGQHGRVCGAYFPSFGLGVLLFSSGRPPIRGHWVRRRVWEFGGRPLPPPVVAGRIASRFGLLRE